MYKKWVDSRPFDIGNTTRSTIGSMSGFQEDDPNLASSCIEIAAGKSKS